MVGVSYHELTAGSTQSQRHSAGQRKQFLLICVVGVAICANAFINAGLLETVHIQNDGIYPGGEYVFKTLEDKDYATTGGIWRRISLDLEVPSVEPTLNLNGDDNTNNESSSSSSESLYDEYLYSVYVDNIESGFGRFFNGILIDHSKNELKERLLATNEIVDLINDGGGGGEDTAEKSFTRMKYEVGDLPSVRSAVATFPFTDGFVSALIHNYKVFPALYKYAKANHDPNNKIVISTTCNRKLQLCKHYVPMIEGTKFLLGKPNTEEYMNSKPKGDTFDIGKMMKGVQKMFGL
jgi:hypothetical protein